MRGLAQRARPRVLGRGLRRLLVPAVEVDERLHDRYRFKLDLGAGYLQQRLFLSPETYEPETQRLIARLLGPGMTAVDAGAHTGFFTLLMAGLVGPSGRVLSFEPCPESYGLLEENVAANRLAWVKTYPLALSNSAARATLSLNPINDGGHSLGDLTSNPDLAGCAPLRLEVATTTLDAVCAAERLERVDLVKLDVEGAEGLVVEGARGLLAGPRAPAIICEVGEAAQRQLGTSERALRATLVGLGYRSAFVEDELRPFGLETRVEGLRNIFFSK